MSTILRSAIAGLIPSVIQLETTDLGIGYNRADACLYGLRVNGGSKSVVLLGGTGSGQVYVHPTYPALAPVLTGANVLSMLTSDNTGHLTGATTRVLTCEDIGASPVGHIHPGMLTGTGTLNYLQKQGASGLVNSVMYEQSGKLYLSVQLNSTLANGTPPLVVASSTLNANLNADMLDGLHASSLSLSSHGHTLDQVCHLGNSTSMGITVDYLKANSYIRTDTIVSNIGNSWIILTDQRLDLYADSDGFSRISILYSSQSIELHPSDEERSAWYEAGMSSFHYTYNNVVSLGTSSYRFSNLYSVTLNVSSAALVTNLNADYLDGYHASAFSLVNHTHAGYLTALVDGIWDATGGLYAPYTTQPTYMNTPVNGAFYSDYTVPNTRGALRYTGSFDACYLRAYNVCGTDYINSGAYIGNGGMIGGDYEGGIYAYANDAIIAAYSCDGSTDTFYYAAGWLTIIQDAAQFSGMVTASRLVSYASAGTSPVVVNSNTLCNNLNADMLDGHHWSEIPTGISGGGMYNALAIWGNSNTLTSRTALRIATYGFGDCIQFTLPFWSTIAVCVGSVYEYGNSPVQVHVVADHTYAGIHISREEDANCFGSFISYKGTSREDVSANISSQGYDKFAYQGMVRISVNDTEYWMPYFSIKPT